jgi:hypothetical protein
MNDSALSTSTPPFEPPALSTPPFEPSALAAALNDPTRSAIGNPRKGQYHCWIGVNDDSDEDALRKELNQLGVKNQINTRRRDGQRYIAVYCVTGLRTIFEALESRLEPKLRQALDTLVRARSPIPDEILDAIWRRYQLDGWDEEQIAKAMIEKPIIDGMGKGWTPRKIRRILAER